MILAELNTEHFTFRALGASKAAARDSVAQAFLLHLERAGSSEDAWRKTVDDGRYDAAGWDGIAFLSCVDDWYGINTYDFGPDNNALLRDDDNLNR